MTEQGRSHAADEESASTDPPDRDCRSVGRQLSIRRSTIGFVSGGLRGLADRLRTSLAPTSLCLVVWAALSARHGISRRRTLGAIGAGFVGAVGLDTAAAREGGDDGGADVEGDRYVVGLEAGTSTASVSCEATHLYRSLDLASRGSVVVGRFDDETRREFENRADVRYVEKDTVRRPLVRESANGSESVDLGDEQRSPWGVERIGAREFHSKGETGDGASVAVLDSGVDPDHETLEVAEGKAFAECTGPNCDVEWADETGHGTHVAGTVGARDNGTGVVGVTPTVDLCAIKVLAADGSGYDSDIAAAIEWCADSDVDVVNLSLGGSDTAQVLEDALAYAYERELLVVAAAGNDGSVGGIDYPAGYDECIAVGATDDRDEVPSWSARGDGIELVAPGEDILSTAPGDEYAYKSGTSMATPHVAAIAAQLMSQGIPHVEDLEDFDNPGGVRAILRDTAEDIGFDDDEQGYGLLNAFDALDQLEPVTTKDVTDVRARMATLNGSLRSFENPDAAEVFFQWRESGGSEWIETAPKSVESRDEFGAPVDDLRPETEYDVRAVLDDGGETTTANVVTFVTGLDALAVATVDVEGTDHRIATVVGELQGVGDAETVDVFCRVREREGEWTNTDSQSMDAIGPFEAGVSGLEPETEYEVEAVAETETEATTGETMAFETDPEPGVPKIERFDLTDDSNGQFVRCNAHWGVSDRDGELELVATELRYTDDDELIHRIASETEGGEANGVHTVRNSDRFEGAGEEYDVTLSVTDAEGHVTEETERITLDERSPPPSIDRFEITEDDFLGTPEAIIEWAVSDEGGELDGVELELRLADDEEVVDSASSMARDEEASGTDSLRDRDGDGSDTAYDVTVRVTDYFEQTTDETVRVTLGG